VMPSVQAPSSSTRAAARKPLSLRIVMGGMFGSLGVYWTVTWLLPPTPE
jgi:hypothetical protein